MQQGNAKVSSTRIFFSFACVADLRQFLNPPSPTLKPLILEALGEDEGRLEHNLKLLETWLSCQRNMPKNYDRNLLVTFLRSCKHDLQRAKKKLERYFVVKTFDEVLYGNRVVTMGHDLKASTYIHSIPLPELTAEGYRIVVFGLSRANIEAVYDVVAALRYILLGLDIRLHSDTLIAGDVYIFDTKYVSPSIVGKIFSAELRRVTRLAQTVYPLRIKAAHFINTNSIVEKFINFMKQFLSDKLARRVFVHSDLDSLHKEIPPSLLPSDIGGEQKSCGEITEEMRAKLIEIKDWFQEYDGVKVTGPIPKQLEQTLSDSYGAEGSFRQLNID